MIAFVSGTSQQIILDRPAVPFLGQTVFCKVGKKWRVVEVSWFTKNDPYILVLPISV